MRVLLIRSINKTKSIPLMHRRQWIVKAKTILLFMLIFGVLVIWAAELQTVAISLVAIAAAIVIAFKEIIMNVSGYFARASAKPFAIGDRIEVDGIRGDVIDQNLFFTKVLEIGPGQITNQYTGRSVNIPNSTFLSKNIINESFTNTYTLHVFIVPIKLTKHFKQLQEDLLSICQEVCSSYIEEARTAFESFGESQGLEAPSVDPRVHLRFLDKETVEFIVRIPAQTSRKGRIEQEIIKDFSEKFLSNLNSN